MSSSNHYPLTHPSEEFQAHMTTILKLPHSPALEKHLRDCAICLGLQEMCPEALAMVREIRFLDHWKICDFCAHGPALCSEGNTLWYGEME
jgi:hypothetical protein